MKRFRNVTWTAAGSRCLELFLYNCCELSENCVLCGFRNVKVLFPKRWNLLVP